MEKDCYVPDCQAHQSPLSLEKQRVLTILHEEIEDLKRINVNRKNVIREYTQNIKESEIKIIAKEELINTLLRIMEYYDSGQSKPDQESCFLSYDKNPYS
jgi:hypothetical protein